MISEISARNVLLTKQPGVFRVKEQQTLRCRRTSSCAGEEKLHRPSWMQTARNAVHQRRRVLDVQGVLDPMWVTPRESTPPRTPTTRSKAWEKTASSWQCAEHSKQDPCLDVYLSRGARPTYVSNTESTPIMMDISDIARKRWFSLTQRMRERGGQAQNSARKGHHLPVNLTAQGVDAHGRPGRGG